MYFSADDFADLNRFKQVELNKEVHRSEDCKTTRTTSANRIIPKSYLNNLILNPVHLTD